MEIITLAFISPLLSMTFYGPGFTRLFVHVLHAPGALQSTKHDVLYAHIGYAVFHEIAI